MISYNITRYYSPLQDNDKSGIKEEIYRPRKPTKDLTTRPLPGAELIGKSAERRIRKFVEKQREDNAKALEELSKIHFD